MQYGSVPLGLRSSGGAAESRSGRVAVPSAAIGGSGRLVRVSMDGQQHHSIGSPALAAAKPCGGGERAGACGGCSSSSRSAPQRACLGGGGVGGSSCGEMGPASRLAAVGTVASSIDITSGDGSAEVQMLRGGSGGGGSGSASGVHQQRQQQHQQVAPSAMISAGTACRTAQTALERPLGGMRPPAASPPRSMGGGGHSSGGSIATAAAAAAAVAVPPVRILSRASLAVEPYSASSWPGSERGPESGSSFAPLPHEVPMTVLQSKWCF